MRFAVVTLFCAALAGCPTAIEDGDDAGQAVADAGQVAADSGSTPADDAGVTPATDSGPTPATDAGPVSPDDAGPVPSSDAGAPLGDAGLPVGVCGTRGGIEDCGPGAFCLFPIEHMCGSTDMGGQCELIPESCTRDYRPVCGCDGNTYSNACQAHVQGVSVEHNGSCEAGCGIPNGRQCDNGEFCLDRGPACGQQRPEGGTCETIRRSCGEIYQPVCGCDNQTYPNLCELVGVRVQLKAEGECEVAPPPRPGDGACGPPRAPVMCAPTHFCNRPAGSCPVGNESTGGACEERPGLCDRMLAPVCGCDNQEYGNPCEANAAGTSVRNEGPCR
jgi:hypothetical protein